MKEEKHTQLIIIKKKGQHEGHHGGAWKVAYADFVTAMMALFIVLWIVSQNKTIKEAVATYFKDPGVFTSGRYGGIREEKSGAIPGGESLIKIEIEKLQAGAQRIENRINSLPIFEKFRGKIQISTSPKGLLIELMEDSEGLFFDTGSAKIKKEALEIFKLLASELARFPNKIIIEGHTDRRPYFNPGYSNWELSVERANAARRVLEENGVSKDQILEIRGLADRRLKHPAKPFDHSNRRVSFIVSLPDELLKN